MEHFYKDIHGWFDYEQLYSSAVSQFKKEKGIFVEVGSWKGKSISYLAVEIINSKKNIELYSVDTFLGGPELQKDEEIINKTLYSIFTQNIKPVKDVVNVLHMPSVEASKKFEDESIDFLFLDASHEYNDVLDDLNFWYPKVKTGGVFAGHDIKGHGVYGALMQFNSIHSKQVTEVPPHSWFFKK